MSEQGPGSDQETTPVIERPLARGVLLAAATLLWMVAMLFSARVTITSGSDVELEVTQTAYAMPGAVSASLVAGTALALLVLTLIGRRRTLGSTARFAIATGTGLAIGLLGAVSIVSINTEGWLFAVVGGTIAAAATIGGAVAGFRIARVLSAICWGALTVFVVAFALNLFQDPLLNAFGSGDSQASQTSAAQWFSLLASVLSGLAAGFLPYVLLRRAKRNAGGADVPWPFYGLAGAGAGLMLTVAEGLTRTAGSRVLELAGKVSTLELTVQSMLSGARFNNALIVLFIGAISATIAIGRTIKPAEEAPVPVRERRNGTARNAAVRSNAASGAARNGTARNGAARNSTAQNGTAQSGTAQNGTAQNGTAQNGTARGGAARANKPAKSAPAESAPAKAASSTAVGDDAKAAESEPAAAAE